MNADLQNGDCRILIGTHALIEEHVKFKSLGLVIIDEQHRFGVAQRARLLEKGNQHPHFLVMTATPIPRTMALSFYGDLDVSKIDQLPVGRKPIKTAVRAENERYKLYKFVKEQIQAGRQAYFVFPLIEASEKLNYKNLNHGFDQLVDVFKRPDFQVDMLHGGMSSLEKIDNTGMSQEDVNQILIGFAKKNDLNIIATNDSHYTEEEDFNAHDILLCVNTGDFKNTPIGQGKGYRFGFPNNQFFFKTTEQMNALFSDIPESIDNTNLLIDRIEAPKINRDILLPNFSLPKGFNTQDDYLRYLVYEGAKKRYGEMTEDLRERIDFELATISNSGYPGYFLIVQDFTSAARKLNVSVGPGRGSAAGSVVAYCTGITNVDPIKYDLLFERFLNPERISMPDIDIDFDDRGREKVIDYVIDKYGKKLRFSDHYIWIYGSKIIY